MGYKFVARSLLVNIDVIGEFLPSIGCVVRGGLSVHVRTALSPQQTKTLLRWRSYLGSPPLSPGFVLRRGETLGVEVSHAASATLIVRTVRSSAGEKFSKIMFATVSRKLSRSRCLQFHRCTKDGHCTKSGVSIKKGLNCNRDQTKSSECIGICCNL